MDSGCTIVTLYHLSYATVILYRNASNSRKAECKCIVTPTPAKNLYVVINAPVVSFNFSQSSKSLANPPPPKMASFSQQIVFIVSFLLYISTYTNGLAIRSKISFPALSGEFEVGTIEVKLTDVSTPDPFAPGTSRSILVQAFYPTNDTENYPFAPYMGSATSAFYENYFHLPNGSLSVLQTNSHVGAPISCDFESGVIILSPSLGASRRVYTAFAEDLASHGFIVISIDHPYDADIVEFPDGTAILSAIPENTTDADIDYFMDLRLNDTIFVLDVLHKIVCSIPGSEYDADLGNIGIFGHSFGGAIAAQIMLIDDRVAAGLNMDGMLRGSVVTTGLDKPFLLMGAGAHYRSTYATWQSFWDNQCGWKRELHLANAEHEIFSDLPVVIELLGLRDSPLGKALEETVGTINGLRANEIQRAYITAFFNFSLRGKDVALLNGPDPEYAEMAFLD